MIKTNLKKLISILAIGFLIATHPAKASSDTGDALLNVYKMQTLSFSILGNYYMFSGLEGDSRYSREMNSDISKFETQIAELTQPSNPSSKLESLGQSLKIWQEFKQLIETNRNDFLTQGYANARLVGELGTKVAALNTNLQAVYDNILDKTQYKIPQETQDTRKMGLIIQTITAEYAARSTSSLGQVMVIEINEGGMDGQAKVFNKLLSKLKKASKPDNRIYKLTDQIAVKWSFIEKSVANYNENAVPFIVNTYGDRITQNLQTVGEHFGASMQAKK